MSHGPGHVSTEPLPGTLGGAFPLPVPEVMPQPAAHFPRRSTVPSQNPSFAPEQESLLPAELQVTAAVPPPTAQQPSAQGTATGHDWSAQLEQLRNDIFGIAMNVSAMNDRIDRMEQRPAQSGAAAQSDIATLRGEIETWLENHLNAAVEHCMHKIINRTNLAASRSAN
ncbi:hypothetical protein [Prosthecobacter sp.]|uniref:hypothetical protein n=1 Tax=Prosthecobacter sp. TaxID=1965333 RepID=UPI0037835635